MTNKEVTGDSAAQQPLNVFQAIAKVQAGLATNGISKDRKNKEQGYQFRGIDDLYNALAQHLSDAGLCILPRILKRDMTERKSAKGNPMFSVVVEAEFEFVSAHDGSKHTVKTFGEAMDMADKATNKAMSAAYKYACLQTFCIPTEGDNDADGTTPDLSAVPKGEFATQQEREQFVANCIDAINKAANVIDLRTQKECNIAKWNAMKGSEEPADVDAYNTIINTAYNPKFTAFRDEALKAPKEKPATVEAAKKQAPVSALIDDEIPF